MVKNKKLKTALGRALQQEAETAKRRAYEKRQEEAAKNGPPGKNSKTKSNKGKGKAVPQPEKKTYNPYVNGESVLLVGEGNFSFAAAWAKRYPVSAAKSVATSYDVEADAKRKYTDIQKHLDKVKSILNSNEGGQSADGNDSLPN